jgi:Rieske Fe-S protein
MGEAERRAARIACGGCAFAGAGATRRDLLVAASLIGLDAMTGATAQPAAAGERPKEGDLLVRFDAEPPTPLTAADIPAGGPPVFAWPMDPAGELVRKGSRLNKVLLLRLDPEALVGVTRERAAEGVVAYSAICPHAGCDVNRWVAEAAILECSCHYSHYNPREGAAVMDGPATRALPALPLRVEGGRLVVAKPFTSRVGITPS